MRNIDTSFCLYYESTKLLSSTRGSFDFSRNFEKVFRESFEDTWRTFVVARSLQKQSGETSRELRRKQPPQGRGGGWGETAVDKRGNILLTRSFAL